jgi:mono/diheme cytochrome c family protein/peroxiredoxin
MPRTISIAAFSPDQYNGADIPLEELARMHRLRSLIPAAADLLAALCVTVTAAVLFADEPVATETSVPAADSPAPPPAVEPVHNLLTDQPTAPVGRRIAACSFQDIAGTAHQLDALRRNGPVVLVVLSTECPMAQRYTQRLIRLYEEFHPRGVEFVAIYPNDNESHEGLIEHQQKAQFPFPIVRDTRAYLAQRLGATMTPQAFVVDQAGILRYRGGIDDNRYEDRVKQHFLNDALTSLVKGEPVAVTEGKSLGCTIHCEVDAANGEVTYAADVARILQDNCQSCHRPGQVGPFALTNYDEARRWSKEIAAYTQSRVMPPWKAAPGFGEFHADRSLSADEINLIARWVEQGTPLGDPRDVPPPLAFPDEWPLGPPDIVLEMPETYTLGAEGEDDYRHFIIPTDFDRDLYVEAMVVQPGNRKIVHHVIVYVDKHDGKARELDAADAGPGYTNYGGPGFDPVSGLGGWAPGSEPEKLPPGTGRYLPKGSDVVLQVHYYRSGFEETDRTRIGLYLSRAENPIRVHTGAAAPRRKQEHNFPIKAGANRHQIDGEREIDRPIYLLSVFPHMHLLGREMKVVAERVDGGDPVPLIWIKDWDFNWQTGYTLRDPLLLNHGDRVTLEAFYDNSADNPHNPHSPPEEVDYGERTTDEMCFAFFNFVYADEYRP